MWPLGHDMLGGLMIRGSWVRLGQRGYLACVWQMHEWNGYGPDCPRWIPCNVGGRTKGRKDYSLACYRISGFEASAVFPLKQFVTCPEFLPLFAYLVGSVEFTANNAWCVVPRVVGYIAIAS